MKKLKIVFIPLVLVMLTGTANQAQGVEKTKAPLEDKTGKREKPSNRDIILMVMQNSDVLLTVDPSCNRLGCEFEDSTIGQYLSCVWQQHADSLPMNSIEINVTEGESDVIKEKHWKATFMIRGVVEIFEDDQKGYENWSWGVSFYILDKSRAVVRKSFMCLGAG